MPNEVTIVVSSRDNSGLDLDKLKARLNELGRQVADARVNVKGDKEATLALDRMQVKLDTLGRRVSSPKISLDGAFKARVEIDALALSLDKLGGKTGTAGAAGAASAGLGSLSGGAMPALIGAGVALTPIIATVGVGLGGLGLAAAGVAKPIEAAASKTGGLRANMKSLDPEQRAVARGLLGLERQYGQFEKALAPDVLGVFNKGLHLAGDLMHEVEPVASATGKAVGGLLGSIDTEFRSGTWRSFFGFMAREAGPDIKLVGNNLLDLMHMLPTLVQDLQPVAKGFLSATDGVLKLAGGVVKAEDTFKGLADGSKNSGSWLSRLAKAAKDAFDRMYPGAKFVREASGALDGLGKSSKDATPKLQDTSQTTYTWAQHLKDAKKEILGVMNAEQTALSTQTTYAGDLVTAANDAASLRNALKLSADRIGLHTQKQRDSFAAANQYITDLGNTAQAAYSSGHGVDAAIRAITRGLPILESAKTKNRAYWQEVRTLEGWLSRLKSENIQIDVNAKGVWHIAPGGGLPGGTAGGPFAAGGMIRGGIPGRDSVVASLMPGEVVVPTGMVNAGAVDHLRGRIPGFAAGGVVGSYGSHSIPGLTSWVRAEDNKTVMTLSSAVARGVRDAFKSGAGSGGGSGHPGPGGGAPSANAALAKRLYPAYASGPVWDAWNYVAMRESGWSNIANNPTSGAYGIAQALPYTKYPRAGWPPWAGGSSNPTAQITWMWNYMAGRYGGPIGAAAHERQFNWYGNGLKNGIFSKPTLIGVGDRGPERVNIEPLGGGGRRITLEVRGGGDEFSRFMAKFIRNFVRIEGGGDVQVAFGG
jgi:hypothetical protein